MRKLITAYTKFDQQYPGYINFCRAEDGSVEVTVRADPKVFDGAYVCAYVHQKGQPGRCTPGDDRCNNYCNMAPEKGKMQDRPLPCRQVQCGETVTLRLSQTEFAQIMGEVLFNTKAA